MLETLGLALIVFLILFWLFSSSYTAGYGAPFVPMEAEVVEGVMRIAEVKPGEIFYDLGSGDGRLVIAAALRGARACGVEIDPLRALYSRFWIWLLRLGKNARIIRSNFFDVDLSGADIVCLYLLQETNEKIQSKLEKELRPGARIVSVAFTFPGWMPEKIDPNGTVYGPIYLYRRTENHPSILSETGRIKEEFSVPR